MPAKAAPKTSPAKTADAPVAGDTDTKPKADAADEAPKPDAADTGADATAAEKGDGGTDAAAEQPAARVVPPVPSAIFNLQTARNLPQVADGVAYAETVAQQPESIAAFKDTDGTTRLVVAVDGQHFKSAPVEVAS